MKSTLFKVYLCMGLVICSWYTFAAAFGWRAPDLGIVNAMDSGGGGYYGGRSFGGSWGGGK